MGVFERIQIPIATRESIVMSKGVSYAKLYAQIAELIGQKQEGEAFLKQAQL